MFALAFGLLIADYMARQVLNAVFALLKAEWCLSDGRLGVLAGVVAVMVGVLTFPQSLLADRGGRVRSLTVMAVQWSLATLFCAMARSYPQMPGGRVLVGPGEAAYGSVGIAVVISVFPRHLRATPASAFMAGGLFGQVFGVGDRRPDRRETGLAQRVRDHRIRRAGPRARLSAAGARASHPRFVGRDSDAGLAGALRLVPLAGMASALCFMVARTA